MCLGSGLTPDVTGCPSESMRGAMRFPYENGPGRVVSFGIATGGVLPFEGVGDP